MITTDLSEFGFREKMIIGKLLTAWNEHGLPFDFGNEKVIPMFNKNSGNVFLTNEDYQVAMLVDDGSLESFYSCPECGHEGFIDEMREDGEQCCKDYINELNLT